MKVVHITTSISKNSACNRISEALNSIGISSEILVLNKFNKVNNEVSIDKKIAKKINGFITYLERKYISSIKSQYTTIFSISLNSINIIDHPIIKQADIIHLHWFNWGLMNIRDIYKLSKSGKKIIWTMHDSWGFTGGCHVRYECEKYINGCNKCPVLNSRYRFDLSSFLWNIKNIYYKKSNFSIVVPSSIHKYYAQKSKLLINKKITVINNPLDVKSFKPIDKKISRSILNLNSEKIILFGAMNIKNTNKGYKYFIEALKQFKKRNNTNNIKIVLFGTNDCSEIENIGYKSIALGSISDEILMNLVYSSADIYISTSIEESFGQTFLECIYSGTPVIGFKKTGCEDIIIHKKNGYLANYKDINDLVIGIEFLINDFEFKTVNEKFSYNKIANDYLKVYKQIY